MSVFIFPSVRLVEIDFHFEGRIRLIHIVFHFEQRIRLIQIVFSLKTIFN